MIKYTNKLSQLNQYKKLYSFSIIIGGIKIGEGEEILNKLIKNWQTIKSAIIELLVINSISIPVTPKLKESPNSNIFLFLVGVYDTISDICNVQ